MNPFTLTTESAAGAVRIAIAGDLDYLSWTELVEAVDDQLARTGLRRLHLDLAAMTWCDSMGLSALLQIRRRCDAAAVSLHLDNRPRFLDRTLAITSTMDYLTAPTRLDGDSVGEPSNG